MKGALPREARCGAEGALRVEAERAPGIGGWSGAREAHPTTVEVGELEAPTEREPGAVVDRLVPAELGDRRLGRRRGRVRRTRGLLDVGPLTLLVEGEQG